MFETSLDHREKNPEALAGKPAGTQDHESSRERGRQHGGVEVFKAERLRHRDQFPDTRTQGSAIPGDGYRTVTAEDAGTHLQASRIALVKDSSSSGISSTTCQDQMSHEVIAPIRNGMDQCQSNATK
ncbi:hypothetical protein ACIGFL_20675 [Pseudomonas sp. NPDC077649]|uniref:hypothetical protein n=1 Tax=Pseudomonas sp. NPDC077649 TaxID=3364423 RepID=UPI0037CBF95D